MMPYAAEGTPQECRGGLLGPGAPLWPLGRPEQGGSGTRHLQIHTSGPVGASSAEKASARLCNHLLRNTTGRGQHASWGATGLWVGALEGQNHLAGRAGTTPREGCRDASVAVWAGDTGQPGWPHQRPFSGLVG